MQVLFDNTAPADTNVQAGPAVTDSTATQSVENTSTEGTAPAADVEGETKPDAPAKTFTQAELDAVVQKRLQKEERKFERRAEERMREQAEARAREVAPTREAFADDEAFLEAHIEHLAEKKAADKLTQRESDKAQATATEKFRERAEKAAEAHPDFHEVTGNPELRINDAMFEFIQDSDVGTEVAYHLGKNPAKAAEIAAMSPMRAARELAAIESQLNSTPRIKTSTAPAPIEPIGTKGGATPSLATADFGDYEKMRAAQGSRWARR